jgi:hypothetical protein
MRVERPDVRIIRAAAHLLDRVLDGARRATVHEFQYMYASVWKSVGGTSAQYTADS